MNQREEHLFPIVVYGGSTAASMSGVENTSACPDALASILRDAVILYEVGTIEGPAQASEPFNTALQPTGGKAAGG